MSSLSLDYFYNKNRYENRFFDEGPRDVTLSYKSGKYTNTGSIDVSSVDGFRQGVEITLMKHFDAGYVKISSGEQGHVFVQNSFGFDTRISYTKNYDDADNLDPVTIIKTSSFSSPTYRKLLNYGVINLPITNYSTTYNKNSLLNGVLEFLKIGARSTYTNIEFPFESNNIKSAVMQGNLDVRLASDKISTIYVKNTTRKTAFRDYEVSELSKNQPKLPGDIIYFSQNAKIVPYDDSIYNFRSFLNKNSDGSIQKNLGLLSGSSSENYINLLANETAATSGFVYDNTPEGTDSIAFGGMTY